MALLNPLERQKQAYENYANNPDNKGLGAELKSLFAGEGPEAAGTMINIPAYDGGFGAGGRMATFMELAESGLLPDDLLEQYMDQTSGSDDLNVLIEGLVQDEGGFLGGKGQLVSPSGVRFSPAQSRAEEISSLEKARREIQENAFKTDPIGNLNQKALLERQAAESDIAAREALGEEGAFQPSALDEIGSILSSLDNTETQAAETSVEESTDGIEEILKEITGGGRGTVVEKPGERKAYMDGASSANQQILSSIDPVLVKSLEESYGESLTSENLNDAFAAAMKDRESALGETPPQKESKSDALERYKKEFEEATGIDASGKVDKSRALMAFGLALMQNKAGKGFNVGKMLQSVASAGESALPALDKATADAKAARISAGKYALQQIKSDEDASKAIEASNRALKKELYLKDLDYANERRLKILEAQLEGGSKLTEALKNTEQQSLRIGAQEIKLGRGQDTEFGSRTVWSDPLIDSREVASAYKKTAQGMDTLQEMEGLLLDMKDLGSDSFGGTAGTKILSRLIEVGNSMGMDLSYPSGDEVSIPSQIEVLQRSVLARFKKFLTQETGNGISNVDVSDIKAALGNFETFGDIDKAVMSVQTMQELFKSSQQTLDPIVDTFLDRRQYRGNEEGEYQYAEVLKMFDKSFGDVNYINFTESVDDNGVKIKDYDIRG